jgi:conjugal transfer pilus assembly protein TraK
MIHLKPNNVLLPLLLAFSTSAPALQVVEAKDGETVVAKISQKEVTRIAFDQSRIRKVTGNAGEFVLEKDDERGQVFIRPAQTDSSKPINVFVSSERATVALLLQPIDGPSDTILIREPREPREALTTTRRGRASVHVRLIKNMLLAMASDARPDDIEVRDSVRELALWPGVRLTLQRTYTGAGIVGEQYQLTNQSGSDIALTERDLYKSGVMAISVEQRQLPAGEATSLFVIRERRSHE